MEKLPPKVATNEAEVEIVEMGLEEHPPNGFALNVRFAKPVSHEWLSDRWDKNAIVSHLVWDKLHAKGWVLPTGEVDPLIRGVWSPSKDTKTWKLVYYKEDEDPSKTIH